MSSTPFFESFICLCVVHAYKNMVKKGLRWKFDKKRIEKGHFRPLWYFAVTKRWGKCPRYERILWTLKNLCEQRASFCEISTWECIGVKQEMKRMMRIQWLCSSCFFACQTRVMLVLSSKLSLRWRNCSVEKKLVAPISVYTFTKRFGDTAVAKKPTPVPSAIFKEKFHRNVNQLRYYTPRTCFRNVLILELIF